MARRIYCQQEFRTYFLFGKINNFNMLNSVYTKNYQYICRQPRIYKRPPRQSRGSSYTPVRLSCQQRPTRRIGDLTPAFLLLAARKRATGVRERQLTSQLVLFQLLLDILLNLCLILLYRAHIILSAQEFSIAVFEFQISKLFIAHQTTFPFQVPYKTRYTQFWGYLKQHMDMIRTIFCFYNITPFYSHSFLNISPTYRFFSP